MKILVTGSQGQVGSDIVKLGISKGFDMTAMNRQQLDITNLEQVNAYLKLNPQDLIINAAAYTAVDKAEQDIELAFSINSRGVENLATVCSQYKIPLFHISTDYVFDGKHQQAYTESQVPSPASIYGASKLEGEEKVRLCDKHIILRVAWVFGEQGNNFVKTMLRLGKERSELSIVNDQTGGPTWSGDIAATLLTLAQLYRKQNNLSWGTYHFTGTPDVTWYQFAQALFVEAEKIGLVATPPKLTAITSEQYPTAANRPKNSTLNCKKINQVFGIHQPDWHIGLQQVMKTWKTL